ncbi:hypothetical protein KM043_003185 [Ampulex compressa]|nr:hypothetical protein KM043_003185 [Ampulex compressa]
MSRKFSRSDALEDISNWSTNDVLNLLRKNGLEDCCHAVAKRQIDGDELLHLTEGKLSLWKSDLTRPLIWSFWTFVEEVRKAPEKYVDERPADPRANEDHLSDTGSWGTEFDDEAAEEQEYPAEPRRIESPPFAQRQRESRRAEAQNRQREVRQEEEETYANFEAIQDEENTYANFEDAPTIAPKNTSRLHSQLEKSLAEQLKEQLKLRNAMKPVVGPKPDSGMLKKTKTDREQPQKSFLHTAPKPKPRPPVETQKRMSVPPPPEPKKPKEQFSNLERHEKELPKPPPVTIRNLDLVANLPMKTAESEDEYESFDEHIIEQNQKKIMSRVSSRQSLASMHHSSAESIYKPSSVTSHEEDEPYEIYESITEAPEDSGYYLSPIQRTGAKAPPPLPAKPPQASSSAPAAKPPLKRPEKPRASEGEADCDGMCSCFYLRLSKQLLGGLGERLADEVSDMIVRIKRGLSRCCSSQPPEPPGIFLRKPLLVLRFD